MSLDFKKVETVGDYAKYLIMLIIAGVVMTGLGFLLLGFIFGIIMIIIGVVMALVGSIGLLAYPLTLRTAVPVKCEKCGAEYKALDKIRAVHCRHCDTVIVVKK